MSKEIDNRWLAEMYRRNHLAMPPVFKSGLCVRCKGTGSVAGMGLKSGKISKVPRVCPACAGHRSKVEFVNIIRAEAAARSLSLEPIKRCVSDILPQLAAFSGPVVGVYLLTPDSDDMVELADMVHTSVVRARAFCVFRGRSHGGSVLARATELGFDMENGLYFWHERSSEDSLPVERQAACTWWHAVTNDKWPVMLFA